MKIGFNPGSIVDVNGSPLTGRVFFLVHGTDIKADVWTMQNSDYVDAENPVLLDTAGRIEDTLFFEAAVVDILVQRYVGTPGQMTDESPDSDFEDFDRFEAGFDFDPNSAASDAVETIADLKDVENPSGIMLVRSHSTPGDCAPRWYLWNPNCNTTADDGCIVSSNHGNGKWCLLCDGDVIKSSWYGIVAGTNEANLAAFCGAPLEASGDYVIKYPSSLYFERGVYSQTTTSIVVSNNRTAVFSCGAKFTTATIIAYDVDVDGVCLNHDYIADFVIPQGQYENSATIRSSWCRSIDGFWRSNAKHLILDRNHLSNDVITSKIDISEAIVEGVYFTPMLQFSTGAYLNFDKCHFVGAKWIFRDDYFLKFADCNFSDDMFWSINTSTVDFGVISQGHHIEVDNWKITDAQNADVWMVWANATGKTYVDLCGRTVSLTFTNSSIYQISNGLMTGTIATNVNLVLDNIGGNPGVYPLASGKTLVARRCNNLTIEDSALPFSNIDVFDCNMVLSRIVDSSDTYYFQRGGSLQGTFKCAGWDSGSGEPEAGNNIALFDCFAHIGNFSWFNKITMRNCEVDGIVHIIPFFESGTPKLYADLSDSTFQNGVAFTDSSVGNADVHDTEIAFMFIVNNRFGGALSMPFMSNNATPYLGSLSESAATYKGNVGNCPRESLAMQAPTSVYDQTHTAFSGYAYMAAEFSVWNLSNYARFDFGAAIEFVTAGGDAMKVDPCCIHSEELGVGNNQFTVHMALPTTQVLPNTTVQIFDL